MGEAPELLPCPFCGGQPDIWKASVDLGLPAWIACIHCKEGVFCTKEHSTTEAAIAAWNTRAPDPLVTALVEALRKIIAMDRRINCRHGEISKPFHVDGPIGKIARAALKGDSHD